MAGRALLATITVVFLALSPRAAAAQPERTLDGTVRDATGAVVARADLTVTCGVDTRWARSDDVGHFEFQGLPARECTVAATGAGFMVSQAVADLRSRESVTVQLELGVQSFQTQLVVTPSRGDREQTFSVPESVSRVDRRGLEARPHQIVPQLLKEEPGVLVQQTTAAQGSPFLRGLTGQQVVQLVDGVRLNTSALRTGPSQYLGWINPAFVDRLEVVRGPASVQYGSDALGGVVPVLSEPLAFSSIGTRVSGSLTGVLGSADLSGGPEGSVTIQSASASLRVGAATRRVGDLRSGRGRDSHAAVTRFLGVPSSVVGTRLAGTGFTQRELNLAGLVRAGSSGALSFVYRRDAQLDVFRYDRLLGGDGRYRSEFGPQQLDLGLLRYERGVTGVLDSLSATFSVNRQKDGLLEQTSPSSVIASEETDVAAYGYQVQGSRRIGTRHAVSVGGEVYDEYIDALRTFEDPIDRTIERIRPAIPDGTRYTSVGLFVQDVAEVVPGRVSVRGGLRYGRFAFNAPADDHFGIPDDQVTLDAVTFHTGTVVSLTSALNLTVGVSRGFRAPNASDLGAIGLTGGGGFEVAPSRAIELGALVGSDDGAAAVSTGHLVRALQPESLYAFDVGFKYFTERMAAFLTVFDLELADQIQRRTAIFAGSVVGTVIGGREVVAQDDTGRAFVAEEARPIVTRVNVDRSRIIGLEAEGRVRLDDDWSVRGFFSMANGRELQTDTFLRRMPPPLGGVSLRWAPPERTVWGEGTSYFARSQTRLSPGDLGDARIGATRSRSTIERFFNGEATDIGLVQNGRLVATGETLEEVQNRVLGTAGSAPLYTDTPGFLAFGARAGWIASEAIDVTAIADNLTDRNYRLHGSGVDAPGFNVQLRVRYRF